MKTFLIKIKEPFSQFIKIGGTIDFFKKYGEILNVNMPLRPDLVAVINNIKQIKMDKYVAKNQDEDLELLDENEEDDEMEEEFEEDWELDHESCLKVFKA